MSNQFENGGSRQT